MSKKICPVCGKYEYPAEVSSEQCEVCGWIWDIVQQDEPDMDGGENRMSLNEAREAFKQGKKII